MTRDAEVIAAMTALRRAVYCLLAALIGAWGLNQFGCKGLRVEQAERLDRFACEACDPAQLPENVEAA